MIRIILAAALSLGLVACSGGAPTTQATSTPSAGATGAMTECGLVSNTAADEKSLYAAEAAYNVAANAYLSIEGTGKLTPALKEQSKAALIKAYDALGVARNAYKLGNTCDLFAAIKQVNELSDAAKGFLPR